jgi:small multidrug resistance family-3 protein
MLFFQTIALFTATAVAEIVGCYLPYLWLRKDHSTWLLLPSVASLICFVWLLSLHPAAAGRVYAGYGGVYVAVALLWLWKIEGVALTRWDIGGAVMILLGVSLIVWGGWRA